MKLGLARSSAVFSAVGGVLPPASAMEAVKKSAVLYHYPCPDGAFAALAAHLYFSAANLPVAFFPNTVYDPIRIQNFKAEHFDDIYLLDYSGPPGFVEEISMNAKSVTILDHHKTAAEMFSKTSLRENVNKIIDMERSGATVAYDYYRQKLSTTIKCLRHKVVECDACSGRDLVNQSEVKRISLLFKLVEDGDLWRWALSGSKAFRSGLKDLNIEYNVNLNPGLFDQLLALDPELIINQGQQTLRQKQDLIDEALEQSYEIALGNGRFGTCLAVEADTVSDLRSELGHQIAEKSRNLKLRGIGAVIYKVHELESDDLLKISLRSLDFEDTTSISEAYGGGGHRNASSFMLKSAELERWRVKMLHRKMC